LFGLRERKVFVDKQEEKEKDSVDDGVCDCFMFEMSFVYNFCDGDEDNGCDGEGILESKLSASEREERIEGRRLGTL
jgi:hypothetical protein